MKNLLLFSFFCLLGLSACKTNEADPTLNPDNCVLNKVVFSGTDYNEFIYDSKGLMITLQKYIANKKDAFVSNTYDTDGKIIAQKLTDATEVKYIYNGSVLTKVQFSDDSKLVIAEYAMSFDANGRISNIKMQNTKGSYLYYENYASAFSYDANGNCIKIDLSDEKGRVISRTEYSEFVAVRSHFLKYKNLYFDPLNDLISNLSLAGPYKFPVTSANRVKTYSTYDNRNVYTGVFVLLSDFSITRNPNLSGMMKERVSNGKTTTYEYSGCQ